MLVFVPVKADTLDRLNIFGSLKTSLKPPFEMQRNSSEWNGKMVWAACLYKYTAQMRAVFKPYEGELAVAKNRKLAQANICS